MSEWQDISTAPKDGTLIMAACRVAMADKSWWDIHIIAGDDGGSEIGGIQSDYYQGWNWDDYTHWMPLPPPPTD